MEFVHLRVRSDYGLLQGSFSVQELVEASLGPSSPYDAEQSACLGADPIGPFICAPAPAHAR